jgi:integrase
VPRNPTGSVRARTLADGTRAFQLRFRVNGAREAITLHEQPGCGCGCGGGWDETGARTELGNVLALVRVGLWKRPEPPPGLAAPSEGSNVPTFADYSQVWLQAKIDGVYGDKPISDSTASDYRWRLRCHLLPFFGRYPLDEIDRDVCLAFKAYKLAEAREIREAIAAGADLRDYRGRRLVPLGPASMRKLIGGLASVLDDAIEDGHIQSNPARSKRMRVRVPKPSRTFLEMDELAALLDAAAEQDNPLGKAEVPPKLGVTASMVAGMLAHGYRPHQIARKLGVTKSTVSFHMRKIHADVGRGYMGRRVICEVLGRTGIRVSELCDLKIGQLRLHDPEGARFRIPDSKTETGIREVQMTPDLIEPVIEHLDRLRRIGAPTGPEDHLIPNTRGGRTDRQRVGKIVGEAAALASERVTDRGLPPLPHVTPHSLRRTYISIALIANNFDVKWVMGQVGHADSKMTMDVYAQLEQRVERSHGTNFDRLLRTAREQSNGDGLGTEVGNRLSDPFGQPVLDSLDSALESTSEPMARGGLEPPTPRFSVVCSTN